MRTLLSLLMALFTVSLYGATPGGADEVLSQLSKIRLDKKQIYNIRDITIRRDVFAITFTRGTIAFLEPVEGKVTGAVFIGNGDIVGIPPDPVEKQQLFRFTRSPLLTESFDSAFFRFTDNTYEEILKEYEDRAQEDVSPDEREQFLPWDQELGGGESAVNYRILSDFLSTSSHPLFWAQLKNNKLGWFSAIYDERLVEEVNVTKTFEAATELGGIWASFNRRSEARNPEAAANEEKSPIDILAYTIDATLGTNATLDAKASVRFRPLWDGERVISFSISPFVTITSVELENGGPVPFFQKEGLADAEVRKAGKNRFIIVLPEPLQNGRETTVRMAYTGDPLRQASNDLFYTSEAWYPVTDTTERARFDLTFHYPNAYGLASSGTKIKEWEDSGLIHSVWESGPTTLMAGFEVGNFLVRTDESGTVPITVIASKDPAVAFKDLEVYRPTPAPEPSAPAPPPGPPRNRTRTLAPTGPVPPSSPDYGIDVVQFSDAMLREVGFTVEYLQTIFGKYPFNRLTTTPMTPGLSQSGPSLLSLRSISFLDKDRRDRLGIPGDVFNESEWVRVRDVAHQWLGQSAGWKSYRDQWIFEGLASYAIELYLEKKYPDGKPARQFMDAARSSLLEKTASGGAYESLGPVWVGYRLSNAVSPRQYLRVLEAKGAWIMHMLRTLMSDERFVAMTREFTQQFDGKFATTWDFKRVAEKHMTPAMDISGDGKLDWFFDNWVFGVGIPDYSVEYKVEPQDANFVISGKITQSSVSEGFIMPVPLYADDELLGRVTVSADDGEFRFVVGRKPQDLRLDPNATILATIQGRSR